MKSGNFSAYATTVIDEFCKEVPLGQTLKAFVNLVKNWSPP